MTRLEQIVVLVFTALIVLAAATTHVGSVMLCLWALAAFYLLGAFWLFRTAQGPPPWVRVLAGACLAAGLYALADSLHLRRELLTHLLFLLPGLLAAGLGIYLLLRRSAAGSGYRPLLLRAALLFGIGAFFAYSPITWAAYRAVLLQLYPADSELGGNVRMFDYRRQAEDALAADDCAAAISAAHQGYVAGQQWLGADSVRDRWRIGGAYAMLYKAYACRARQAYDQRRYAEALRSYQTAHHFLATGDHRDEADDSPSAYWAAELAWSFDNMAFCWLKQRQFARADSLFLLALRTYQRVYPKPDAGTARLLSDLAQSQAAAGQRPASTMLYRRANRVLAQAPDADAAADSTANTLNIVLNYLEQDSLAQAQRLLQTLTLTPADSGNWYKARLYEAICLHRQSRYKQADQVLTAQLRYLEAHHGSWPHQVACQALLAKNCLALAVYTRARAYATAAHTQLRQRRGAGTDEEARCLEVLAAVDQAQGHYDEAARQYRQLLATY